MKYSASKTTTSACITEVEVTTSGLCGGDTGHGGYATVTIRNYASMDWNVEIEDEWQIAPGIKGSNAPGSVTLTVRGDCEIENLMESLAFAADFLKRIIRDTGAGRTE